MKRANSSGQGLSFRAVTPAPLSWQLASAWEFDPPSLCKPNMHLETTNPTWPFWNPPKECGFPFGPLKTQKNVPSKNRATQLKGRREKGHHWRWRGGPTLVVDLAKDDQDSLDSMNSDKHSLRVGRADRKVIAVRSLSWLPIFWLQLTEAAILGATSQPRREPKHARNPSQRNLLLG